MGIRPSSQSSPTAVTKHIGTDIDDVRVVADNIDTIVEAAERIDTALTEAEAFANASEQSAIAAASSASTTNTNAITTTNNAASTNADVITTNSNASITTSARDAAQESETNALNSASNAAGSAASALSSKNSVDVSESNVLAAEIAINNTFDNFDDRFLGTFGVAPTLDNDGDSLSVGAIYYDSVTLSVKFWNGATWDDPDNSAATSATAAYNSQVAAGVSESNASSSETASLNAQIAAEAAEDSASQSADDALLDADRAQSIADTFIDSVQAMTKAEFFAQAEQRIRNNAGSGFAEWGKHHTDSLVGTNARINQGMWTIATSPNKLIMGQSGTGVPIGISRSVSPLVNVNGHQLNVTELNTNVVGQTSLDLPDAPDGLDKADGTGRFADLTAAIVAGGNDLSASVLSRQDFVFLEVFHEKISDKDQVYPLGNVQYGASTWEGIALSIRDDGYTRFGEWDTTTTGNYATWSALSDADKAKFIQDPENNIYSDDGELIQVRYRIRVVKGLGDNWGNVNTQQGDFLNYSNLLRVTPQGSSASSPTLGQSGTYFYSNNYTSVRTTTENGMFEARRTTGDDIVDAHNGLCFAVPIALVQRRNQGAYHPVYNPEGCRNWNGTNATGNGTEWYQSIALVGSTTADAFNPINASADTTTVGYAISSGDIGDASGRSDGKHYDATYASDVKDLRMSSKRLPLKEIRDKYKRMAIAGEVRGFEGVPFTRNFVSSTVWATRVTNYILITADTTGEEYDWITSTSANSPNPAQGNIIVNGVTYRVTGVAKASDNTHLDVVIDRVITSTLGESVHVGVGDWSSNNSANPTWTDIIGDPANIAATFPSGVEGQWIPVIPNGVKVHPLNRKVSIDNEDAEYTSDDGATWSTYSGSATINTTTNARNAVAAGSVLLSHYETQAHFTQDDVNSEVLDLGGEVYATSSNFVNYGNILCSTLINKIPTAYVNESVIRTSKPMVEGILDTGLWAGGGVKHLPIENLTDSPAIKTLDYLSHENNVGKLMLAYKEMVYDTDWGDNNQFEVTNNQSTLTDDNGNTVLYGMASFDTQFFIVEE